MSAVVGYLLPKLRPIHSHTEQSVTLSASTSLSRLPPTIDFEVFINEAKNILGTSVNESVVLRLAADFALRQQDMGMKLHLKDMAMENAMQRKEMENAMNLLNLTMSLRIEGSRAKAAKDLEAPCKRSLIVIYNDHTLH